MQTELYTGTPLSPHTQSSCTLQFSLTQFSREGWDNSVERDRRNLINYSSFTSIIHE